MFHDYFTFLRTEHPLILQLWFFGFGACVGSFLNVCVLRIPLGKSIVTPGSHCACGKPIAWYDNIPIFTWFLLRGRARCCGRYFSIRYPMVELVTAVVFWWLWYSNQGSAAYALAGMIFFALLFMGSLIDLDHMVLPDSSTIGGMLAGVFLSFVFPHIQQVDHMGIWMVDGMRGMVMSMIGVLVGTGIIFWIRELGSVVFRKEAMGYGDIWLIGSIGAFCGWQGAIFAIFGGAVIGCLVILPWMLIASIFKKPGAPDAVAAATPTGATTAPGALAATEAGEPVHEDAPFTTAPGQPKPIPADESVLAPTAAPAFGVEIPFGPWLALGGFIYYAFAHDIVNDKFDFIHKLIFDMPGPA